MVLECRLSNLCSTETIFKKSTTHYENNLRQSGYNKKLTYKPTDTNHQKHSKHKRKIIWFNPPFNKNVSAEIGKSAKHKICYKQPQYERFKQYH